MLVALEPLGEANAWPSKTKYRTTEENMVSVCQARSQDRGTATRGRVNVESKSYLVGRRVPGPCSTQRNSQVYVGAAPGNSLDAQPKGYHME